MARGSISGVYKIFNTVTNQCYVGSSKDTESRWRVHKYLLARQKHTSRILQLSYNKHGLSVFKFSVLEECDPTDLRAVEQRYLDQIKPHYNIKSIVSGVVMTPETRAKISASLKGKTVPVEARESISQKLKGFWVGSEAQRLALSKGRISRPHTEESKQKISQTQKKRLGSR